MENKTEVLNVTREVLAELAKDKEMSEEEMKLLLKMAEKNHPEVTINFV